MVQLSIKTPENPYDVALPSPDSHQTSDGAARSSTHHSSFLDTGARTSVDSARFQVICPCVIPLTKTPPWRSAQSKDHEISRQCYCSIRRQIQNPRLAFYSSCNYRGHLDDEWRGLSSETARRQRQHLRAVFHLVFATIRDWPPSAKLSIPCHHSVILITQDDIPRLGLEESISHVSDFWDCRWATCQVGKPFQQLPIPMRTIVAMLTITLRPDGPASQTADSLPAYSRVQV